MRLEYSVWNRKLPAPFFPSIGFLEGIFSDVAIDGVLLRIIADNSPVACTSSLEVVLAISHSYDIISKLFPHYVRIQRGDRGS